MFYKASQLPQPGKQFCVRMHLLIKTVKGTALLSHRSPSVQSEKEPAVLRL